MSTQPGHDSWRDTGLEQPDLRDPELREVDPDDVAARETVNLLEEALAPQEPPSNEALAEEYRPRTPRPDLAGEADEADVAEQAEEVPGLGDDEPVYEDVVDEYVVDEDEQEV
ncbi:hypothetical protein DNL40_01605 [Xylanimonas oleitrophica]|uniref:DUF5709 domain-containing protein n=1 Tax=Xylanimonas oleitrophica TaxID=2607479 RepID=A0A2W5X2K3_9MICO|nr:hypothetical protein [Xylanimonas oleitrophica]PZR55106.1 hypothetical protein DNL40_01605 [Xylanimonas oleitrophica]